MLSRARRGFSLAELLLALVLVSVVSTAIVRVMVNVLRLHRMQNERVQSDANLRTALAYLQREFRQLNTTDPAGGDIVRAEPFAIVYRSMRELFYVCGLGPSPQFRVVLQRVRAFHQSPLDLARDSIMLFARGDRAKGRGAGWIRAGVLTSNPGMKCVDGSNGIHVTLGGISSIDRGRIELGAPVRSFTMSWIRLYTDARAQWWLGAREWSRNNGWSRTQPVVGPFAEDGVRFWYWDANGAPTQSTTAVRRIGVRLLSPIVTHAGRNASPHTLESTVALRNNATGPSAGTR